MSPSETNNQCLQPIITLADISHRFQTAEGASTQAIAAFSLDIRHHEFVSVIGPSGCGKSTILRIVAGLIRPTAGTVRIFGHEVSRPREDIGIVFQRPTLLPWLRVIDNIIFPIKHKFGTVDQKARDRAHALLEMVGLKDFARRYPHELSGGMQQRTAIARSLLHDPDILLMDEPFSALDALTRDEMALELLRILSERPKNVVFVTHSIPEALLLSDRIVVMSARPGQITEIVDVPFSRPRTLDTTEESNFNEIANHIRRKVFSRNKRAELA